MSEPSPPPSVSGSAIASVEHRLQAIESALAERGVKLADVVAPVTRLAPEAGPPQSGARVVAKAWTDAAFRQRLLTNGLAAMAEMGIEMPPHHRHLVVLENTPSVHNLICCTLCSCTAYTVIGAPPDWYKDLEYRARVVRESRSVLAEMGLALAPDVELRVWDTTADTRYMVLPMQPPETEGWPLDKLAALVSQDAMIGAARL